MTQAVAGSIDPDFWRGRRVLVTGHTGFIGGWMSAWLKALGSDVHGIALPPPTEPSFHKLTALNTRVAESIADIRIPDELTRAYEAAKPDIVIHLAAQALVRTGYEQPEATFATNLMGTVHLLECVRRFGAESVVVMTSDKVYGPGDGRSAHREGDPLGAHDPYGGSKACCELAVESYAHSFLSGASAGLATVRAGNVIGGGDWQADRLIPDAIRAFAAGKPLVLRFPDAVRPWQHVLDAVQGLLATAQAAHSKRNFIGPWNVGPLPADTVTVGELGAMIAAAWGDGAKVNHEGQRTFPETHFLAIDGNRARTEFRLATPWSLETIVSRTVNWYKDTRAGQVAWTVTMDQIAEYQAGCVASGARG